MAMYWSFLLATFTSGEPGRRPGRHPDRLTERRRVRGLINYFGGCVETIKTFLLTTSPVAMNQDFRTFPLGGPGERTAEKFDDYHSQKAERKPHNPPRDGRTVSNVRVG